MLYVHSRPTPKYRSQIDVTILPTDRVTAGFQNSAQVVAGNFARQLHDPGFLNSVKQSVQRYGLDVGTPELSDALNANVVNNTSVLVVQVDWKNAKQAKLIATQTANTLAETNRSTILTVKPDGSSNPVFNLVPGTATLPKAPQGPSDASVLAAWLLGALLLGCAAAVIWDRLFPEVREPEDVLRLGLPIVGVIPRDGALDQGPRLIDAEEGRNGLSLAFSSLRTNILLLDPWPGAPDEPRSVAVVGVRPDSGSRTVAANVALEMGRLHEEVVLLDANPVEPRQTAVFGLEADGDAQSVRIVTASPDGAALGGLLGNRSRTAHIVVETSAIDSGEDVRLASAIAQGTVLVVRSGECRPARLRELAAGWDGLTAPVVGVVLTGVTRRAAKRWWAGLAAPVMPEPAPIARIEPAPVVVAKSGAPVDR